MILTRNLILQLKAVKEERQLSLGDILNLIEQNGDYLSKTSLSRLFKDERIDRLMNALFEKDKDYSDLLKKNLSHREP